MESYQISFFFLLQLQNDIGDRAPAYLRDLIGRLSTFSDEPRLAGLVGFVVTLMVDMVYTSKRSSVRGKGAGPSSSQVNQGKCGESVEKSLHSTIFMHESLIPAEGLRTPGSDGRVSEAF